MSGLLRLLPNSPVAAGDAVAGRLRFLPAAADGEAVAGRLRGCSRGDRELGLADCGEPAGDRRWADTMSRTLIGYQSAASRIGNRPPSTGAPHTVSHFRQAIPGKDFSSVWPGRKKREAQDAGREHKILLGRLDFNRNHLQHGLVEGSRSTIDDDSGGGAKAPGEASPVNKDGTLTHLNAGYSSELQRQLIQSVLLSFRYQITQERLSER